MILSEDNIVTVDFETYYDVDYTLRKLSTSEYVRDPRFHAHCVGIKIGSAPTQVYSGEDIPAAIKAIDWSKYALLCHNTAFDGLILTERYGVKPAYYLDTLSMSRALHGTAIRHDLNTVAKIYKLQGKVRAKALNDTKGKLELSDEQLEALMGYCGDDTSDTYELFWRMFETHGYPDDELDMIDVTIRMFTEAILEVDHERAQRALEVETGKKVAALLLSGTTVEHLMSNQKFAELLKQRGYNPPMKLSPTTGELTYAFAKSDAGFQAIIEHPDEGIAALARARLAVKSTINETRAARLMEAGRDSFRLPVLLHYCGAHTTRWSGGNKLNLQNLPRGGELRKSILAPDGFVLVVADSAQIEARVNAWLAGEEQLLSAFRNKRDVYSEFASVAFGYPVDRKKKALDEHGKEYYPQFQEGFIGKTCILGLGYSMGWMKLKNTLEKDKVVIDPGTAQELVDRYRETYSNIPKLWKFMERVLAQMSVAQHGSYKCISWGDSYIQLPNGLKLLYPNLDVKAEGLASGDIRVHEASYHTTKGRSNLYGGLLTENVVQALARCIVGEQLLRINKRYRVVTTTHDEIVACVPAAEAKTALDFMIKEMSTPPTWAPDLPLAAEGGFDVCYSK